MRLFPLCFALFLSMSACSSGLCPTVVRSAVQNQTKVSDGFRALDQVRALTQGVPMPESTRKRLNEHTQHALAILTEVNAVLASSIPACNEPALEDKFKALSKTWTAIKAVLALFSNKAGVVEYVGKGVGAGSTGVKIPDPVFYEAS